MHGRPTMPSKLNTVCQIAFALAVVAQRRLRVAARLDDHCGRRAGAGLDVRERDRLRAHLFAARGRGRARTRAPPRAAERRPCASCPCACACAIPRASRVSCRAAMQKCSRRFRAAGSRCRARRGCGAARARARATCCRPPARTRRAGRRRSLLRPRRGAGTRGARGLRSLRCSSVSTTWTQSRADAAWNAAIFRLYTLLQDGRGRLVVASASPPASLAVRVARPALAAAGGLGAPAARTRRSRAASPRCVCARRVAVSTLSGGRGRCTSCTGCRATCIRCSRCSTGSTRRRWPRNAA